MMKSISERVKKYASNRKIENFGKNYIPWVLLAALTYYHALYVHGFRLNSSNSMTVPKMVLQNDYHDIGGENFLNKTEQGKTHRSVIMNGITYAA